MALHMVQETNISKVVEMLLWKDGSSMSSTFCRPRGALYYPEVGCGRQKSEGDINIKAHDDDPPPIMRPHTAKGARQTNSLVVRSAHPTNSKYQVDAEKFPKLAKKIAMWEDKKTRLVLNSGLHGSAMTITEGECKSHPSNIG